MHVSMYNMEAMNRKQQKRVVRMTNRSLTAVCKLLGLSSLAVAACSLVYPSRFNSAWRRSNFVSLHPSSCSNVDGCHPLSESRLVNRSLLLRQVAPTSEFDAVLSKILPAYTTVKVLPTAAVRRAIPTVIAKVALSTRAVVTTAATSTLRGGAVIVAASATTSASSTLGRTWFLPAVACATSYALYNLFIKKSSSSIDPILGGVLLQFVAALVGTLLLVFRRGIMMMTMKTTTTTTTKAASTMNPGLSLSRSGLIWAIAAGLAVGVAELLSFVISGMGVPATQSIPIIVGGSIMVGTIVGSIWFQERLSRMGWLGVTMIAVGIALVSMDPGSGTLHH